MIVWPLLNLNFACEKCQTGHRNGSCAHTDRKLLEIRSKGRPTSQCSHCRARRKEGVGHSHHRCMCGDGSTILRKKVQVHFDPNVILVFTPERSNVDALRKQLEDTPKSTLLIRRKAKGGKGTGGEGSEADALEISYTHVDVIEESVNLDLKKMMENPCTCQFGGTCICSELPPSKSCGSVKAKKFTASNSAQRPGLASSALLANIAAYPRPIEIGPPPTSSPFPYAAGIAIPALPPMMGHQPILPMPHPGQLGPLVPPIGGASTAVMNQRVPTLLPSGLSMPTNPSFAGAMKSNQQFTDTGGHDPELLSALFALQQGGAVGQGMPLQPISGNSINSPMLETQSSSSCCTGRRNTQDIWASAPKSCCGGISESKPVRGGCCGSVAPPPRNATRCGCQGNSVPSGGCCGGGSPIPVQNGCCGTSSGKSASGCCGSRTAEPVSNVGTCGGSSLAPSRGSSCCGTSSSCGCSGGGCGCSGGGCGSTSGSPYESRSDLDAKDPAEPHSPTCECGCHQDRKDCEDCAADLCSVHLMRILSNGSVGGDMHDAASQSAAPGAQPSCCGGNDAFDMSEMRNALCGCGCGGAKSGSGFETEGQLCRCGT